MYNEPQYLIVFQTVVVMLSVLSLRLKLWQKSFTTFIVLMVMIGMIIFKEIVGIEFYVEWHPIILSVFLPLITVRAVMKERNDKLFGGLHRKDCEKTCKKSDEEYKACNLEVERRQKGK